MVENRFEKCCFDFELVRKLPSVIESTALQFSVYYHKNNNSSCHCLNRRQLGQYWHYQ